MTKISLVKYRTGWDTGISKLSQGIYRINAHANSIVRCKCLTAGKIRLRIYAAPGARPGGVYEFRFRETITRVHLGQEFGIELEIQDEITLTCKHSDVAQAWYFWDLFDAEIVAEQWELAIYAMRRSGHHAVIEWFRRLFDDTIVINDLNHNALVSDTLRTVPPFEETLKQCLIYNFEDPELAVKTSTKSLTTVPLISGKRDRRFDVLVLRDPFNLFASRLKAGWENLASIQVSLWIEHAREFIGETNYLENKVTVNYCRWFSDEEYRKSLARFVNREFSDNGLEIVSSWGGGSSFDAVSFQGRAQKMDVMNRWRYYEDNRQFRAFFDSTELRRLSKIIFGDLSETQRLFSVRSGH